MIIYGFRDFKISKTYVLPRNFGTLLRGRQVLGGVNDFVTAILKFKKSCGGSRGS